MQNAIRKIAPQDANHAGESGIEATLHSIQPTAPDAPLVERITAMHAAGTSLAAIAIESGLKTAARVSACLAGQGTAEESAKLAAWLDEADADILKRADGFVMTPAAIRYLAAFEHARMPRDSRGRRGVAMIFGTPGCGKTKAAEYLERMDEGVIYIIADGELRTWNKLTARIARACAGEYCMPLERGESWRSRILHNLPKGSLIIFDHAHLMQFRVMEQLLSFLDDGIALAFIGNQSAYTNMTSRKLTQLTSRAAGATVLVDAPDAAEVDAHLGPLGIEGMEARAFCHLIGRQDGGIRYLYDTAAAARRLGAWLGNDKVDVRVLKIAAARVGCWTVTE